MDGASALSYEQMTLRAFIFVGVGNEKCVADYVAQLLPSLLFSLTANNFATKWGAAAGILVGVAVVTYLTATGLTLRAIFPSLGSLGDFNIRIVALLANVVVLVCRQPHYPHLDSHRQGRGMSRSYPESFAPRTFVTRTNGP